MSLLILAGAVLLDLAFGEPPNAIHPVAWIGKLIAGFTRLRPRGRPAFEFAYGLLTTAICVGIALAAGVLAGHVLARAPVWAQVVVSALLLKPLFAIRALPAAAAVVGRALERGDLPAAQSALKALVSRDPNLPEPLVVSAAVESVAENLCDSVVAPLLFFALFGLPGAAAYRAANTLDAMIGYRGEYEWYGKAAARLDDALNYVPGRLAGLLLCAGAVLAGTRRRDTRPGPGVRAWETMRAQACAIASPNAGWSMAAMAGGLAVTLEKPGEYRLDGGEEPLRQAHIAAGNRVYAAAVGLLLVGVAVLLGGVACGSHLP